MSIDISDLCMGCMSAKAQAPGGECSKCGYADGMPYDQNYLAPKTVIGSRYIVGKMVTSNGEATTYIGFDLEENMRVWVQEYLPSSLCIRNQADDSIIINAGCETHYKSLMADFEDLLKALGRLSGTVGILPLVNICHENNTVYAVFRYIRTMSLGQFVNRSGGELIWAQAKKLFMPFLNTMMSLHSNGIVHRGLSPDTVHIDQNGRLWVTGFATSALRTNRSEVVAELFPGYSAPEQYSISGWQGTWTDIYAVAAIFYKTLTGTMPPESVTRKINDNLCPALELNGSIPQNVSDAIGMAMLVSVEQRVQTMGQLSSLILESTGSNTMVYNDGELAKKNMTTKPSDDKNAPNTPKKLGSDKKTDKSTARTKQQKKSAALYGFIVMIITTLILGFAAYLYLYDNFLDKDSNVNASVQPSSSISAEVDNKKVAAFIGKRVDEVVSNSSYAGRYTFNIKEEYHPNVENGVIFQQNPESGSLLVSVSGKNSSTPITLYVSKGAETVMMPNVVGNQLETAVKTLSGMGIDYQVMTSFQYGGSPNQVVRTSIQPQTPVRKKKDVVLIIVVPYPEASSSSEESSSSEGSEDNSQSSSSDATTISSSSESPPPSSSSQASSSSSRPGVVIRPPT